MCASRNAARARHLPARLLEHQAQPPQDQRRAAHWRKAAVRPVLGERRVVARAAEDGDARREQRAGHVRPLQQRAHRDHDAVQHVQARAVLVRLLQRGVGAVERVRT
eukprot:2122017-Prymnesium_polylepis.1